MTAPSRPRLDPLDIDAIQAWLDGPHGYGDVTVMRALLAECKRLRGILDSTRGLITLEDPVGRPWEDILAARMREVDRMRELGLLPREPVVSDPDFVVVEGGR